ncbi:MAG: Sjogren's syndrome/scleroderma autoantigen 1 family protein [Candidatus Methanoperedens sp.]
MKQESLLRLFKEKTFGDSMTGKESDDKIQMITKLLEKGGTMLATHHDCGAPMFRYQGKVICPVCEFQERKQEQQQEQQHQQKQQIGQGQQKMGSPGNSGVSGVSEVSGSSSKPVLQISNIIANKIRNLTASLETETELGRIRDKMECIERGVRILKLLREIE